MRKIFKTVLVLMSAIMLFACIGNLAMPATVNAGLVGDVNEDGIVNSKDLSAVQKIILGQPQKDDAQNNEQIGAPEYDSLYFNSLEEFEEWKKDDKKYAPEASEALIKAIDRDGGILVPYFNDISVVEMKEDDVAIMLRFGNENEGKGYAYRFKSEDVHGLLRVYLLDEADEADAAENPLNYVLLGKEYPLTDKQMENTPYKAKEFELFDEKYQGFYCPSSDDKENGEEKLFFIYDGHFIVKIQLFKDSDINALDFAQKLSFKNIEIDK